MCDPCDVNFPSDCNSGVCPAGECAALDGFMPIGCACFEDDHCRGGRICVDGLCEAQGPAGQSLLEICDSECTDDAECESGWCAGSPGQCADGFDGVQLGCSWYVT